MATDEVRFSRVLFVSAVKSPESAWEPRADVYRISGGWLVKLELAGVDPEDVRLDTRGDLLRIEGTRRDDRVQGCLGCHRLEIDYSRFERLLELPGLKGSATIEVTDHSGMLWIRIQTESQR